MSTDPLTQAFFEEAAELLADFEAGLLRLEESPDDGELLNRIFRSAHTLKGNSSMLGFDEIARFTHVLEDLLDQLRKGVRVVTPSVVDTLLASEDIVRSLLSRAQADGRAPTAEEAAAIERVREGLRALSLGQEVGELPGRDRTPPPPPSGARTLYEITFRPPADLLRRGLDPLQVIHDLARLGEILKVNACEDVLPPLVDMDPEQCYLGWSIFLLSTRTGADIAACFDFVAAPEAMTIQAMAMDDGSASDVPEDTIVRADEAAAVTAAPAPAAVAIPAPAPAAAEGRKVILGALAAESASIRVPIDKVDRLINLVGELVITQSMVAQTVYAFTPDKLPRLAEAVAQMDRHAHDLHERMMAVRMIPIRTLFGRFPRLVRDLAAGGGKLAVLELSGEETELDKTVIEKIGDPLTHLIRNAVDHGLESPDVRRAAGKPETGRIRMEAYQQGGSIYIEVTDDGKGLDRDRIVAKAVANGLVVADQAFTDEEAFAFIFRPGFSTAEKITEISGRGVGMDVVKRNVEALGGTITIRSERGRGTTFKIKLPLTLAILDGQSLRVGGETYIIPLVSIVESVRPRPHMVHTVLGAGEAIAIRGRVLPMLRLHRLFSIEGAAEDPTDGIVVIVEHEGVNMALLVDELLGQQQVVIKSLETHFRRMDGVAGATILGDGRVSLILDVPGLVALAGIGRATADAVAVG